MSQDQLIGRDVFQFIPLPYNLRENYYRIWFDQYLAFQESEFPAMISLQGEPGTVGSEIMIGNQKLLNSLGIESLGFTLNELLLSIVRDSVLNPNEDLSPKPQINRIRDDEPLKATLEIQTPTGVKTLNLNIGAYLFNGEKIGQYIEVLGITEVSDTQIETVNQISDELLTELIKQSNAIAYYLDLGTENPGTLEKIQLYTDPRLTRNKDVPIQNLNEFFETLVIPEDLDRTLKGVNKAIEAFMNSDQNKPQETVHPIRVKSAKGDNRDLMHKIIIKKVDGKIILTGYGLDLTDQNFHASLLDIIHELTTLSNYGQQLDLIVGRIKNIMPGVGTISIARPSGEDGFTFDIRHKFEDSLITNTDDIDKNLVDASMKILRRVYHSKGPVIIADYLEDDDTAVLVERYNVRSYVGVPIIINGKVVGVINLSSHLPNAFSLDDIDRIQVLSRFLAIAIDREMTLEVLQVEIANAVRESGMLLREQEETITRIRSISAAINHDLRTPLSVINTSVGLIQMIVEKSAIDPEIREKIVAKVKLVLEQVSRFAEMLTENVELLKSSADFADKMEDVEIQSLVLKAIENCNTLPRPAEAEVIITPFFDKIPKDFMH